MSTQARQGAAPPLSAITWLDSIVTQAPDGTSGAVISEPPVAQSALGPVISVMPLERQRPPVGLVSPRVTGLPIDLWASSAPSRIAAQITRQQTDGLPALQSLLLTLLVTETQAAATDHDQVLLARLDRLLDSGATEPAQALAQDAGPAKTPARFKRWFDATLLNGDEDRSCAALTARPYLHPGYEARIFCAARRGDWIMADLMFTSAAALELLPEEDLALLERFLAPEYFEGAPPLPQPKITDPLRFRLFETIGETLPTAPLPRRFAAADLRDVAGWKAQLEAAERLTRSGAMSPNQLFGLFTERKPAASGGIWDRVAAVQALEAAIAAEDTDAIAAALPDLWHAAQSAGLEIALAEVFAPDLARLPLSDPKAAELAWRLQMLSRSYEAAAQILPDAPTEAHQFWAAVAKGEVPDGRGFSDLSRAIAKGFASDATLPPAQMLLMQENRLGETILLTMESYAHGATGNLGALSQSLAAMRLIGLEDTARRAALQLMILGAG